MSTPLPDLPQDATLCPGDALSAAHLRQLLRAALPDKSRYKAAGWFGQTDFLLTRAHVDEDQDAYQDGLFITLRQRWDFWVALPPPNARARHPLARAWARLRPAPALPGPQELVRLFRPHADASGPDGRQQSGHWQPLDAAHAPPEALHACAEGWRGVLRYWRLAEGQRRAGRPLRARLHAALTAARVQALTLLPLFTGQRIDGWTDDDGGGHAWADTRARHPHHGERALLLQWSNGLPEAAPPDERACYQIELTEGHGTAHPPGLRLSYRQRGDEPFAPLPNDAVEHMQRLLRLFTALEQQPPPEPEREPPPLALPCPPPHAAHASDAEVFGPALMALSRDWQAAGRAHAAVVRERWAAQPDACPLPVTDPRCLHAAAVLRLARAVHARADADLSERFHHRFAFAPVAYARHTGRYGLPVQALRWQPDGALHVWVAGRCWRVSGDGLRMAPAPDAADAAPPVGSAPHAMLHGAAVHGDAQGCLHGMAEDGRELWRHYIGCGAVLCLAVAPDDTLAVGTAGGSLALLRKSSGPQPQQYGTSRYAEMRRVLFWSDAEGVLAW